MLHEVSRNLWGRLLKRALFSFSGDTLQKNTRKRLKFVQEGRVGKLVEQIPTGSREAILGQLHGRHPRYALMLRIGIETGLRVSDVLRIQAGKIKPVMSVKEQKTRKYKECRLSAELVEDIRAHIKRHNLGKRDYLIFSRSWDKRKPIHRTTAWRAIHNAAYEAGLSAIGTHSMRKTYAQEVYRLTGDIQAVKKALGHSRIETTKAYVQEDE
jgi:integrase